MLSLHIPSGALFYGQTKRRLDVDFDNALREKTLLAAEGVHDLFRNGITPPPDPGPKCKLCSLKEECLPDVIVQSKSATTYLKKLLQTLSEDEI